MSHRFLQILRTPTPKLAALLAANVIGTPGAGMLYQHRQTEEKTSAIPDPYYAVLKRGDDYAGTCCFCSRDTLLEGQLRPAFYLRYLTFQPAFRSREQPAEKGSKRGSALRAEMRELLEGKHLGVRAAGSFFHYAYVEPANARSARLCREFGFETVRRFSTVLFHRLQPKDHARIESLAADAVPQMQEALRGFYKHHTMFCADNLFTHGTYYVMRNSNGLIVAGVQAAPQQWNILELPGKSGTRMLKLFSALPFLNRLISSDYRFLVLEGLYVVPGHEALLEELFEAVLARHRLYTAMLWLDSGSDLYKRVSSLRLGLLHKLHKGTEANVICHFVHVQEEEQERYRRQPAYISGVDIT